MGRARKLLTRAQVSRANFLWFTNDRNIGDIAKIIGCGPPVVYLYIFKTKDEYERTTDQWRSENLSDGDFMQPIRN